MRGASRSVRLSFLTGLIGLMAALFGRDHANAGAGYQDMTTAGIETLQQWYDWSTGLWATTGWWNSANALTVLVNYSSASGSTTYQQAIENTFARRASRGFLNNYYDDEGWWALAWIDAYDWSGDSRYLDMARSIFDDMAAGWDDVCGGGIWWSKDRTYKNAIANELFLSVAAHLANRVSDPDEQGQDFAWAEQEWQWFLQSGMINADNLINDGLNADCQNNHRTTWTYNQGVVLGGLAELSEEDPDPILPDTAQAIASAALDRLTDADGVLHDVCEPNCGRDGVQFKGIFVRNLAVLNGFFPDMRYVTFAGVNAWSIWNADQGPDYQFGQVWSGPFDAGDAARQSCALDALVSAVEMDASVSNSSTHVIASRHAADPCSRPDVLHVAEVASRGRRDRGLGHWLDRPCVPRDDRSARRW
jgi:predicted alpha-1,6-mannanase (GH76 family)